ncbi:MEMO1 family [Mycena crocata]|nr:MEMO1 family [Mycena crocata]
MSTRAASHAGDWYTADRTKLNTELSGWLDSVDGEGEGYPIRGCKAVIAPHAGYAYSGPAAAWAYKAIDTRGIKRVFLLGPSHHVYLDGCALSSCTSYATPLGDIPLDLETIRELTATGKFERFSKSAEEDEHSLEMHLPYIRKVFEGIPITLVPIVVGALSTASEAAYGALLAPHLAREDTLCVVSSDFCHWGTRFSYTYYYPSPAPSSSALPSFSTAPSPHTLANTSPPADAADAPPVRLSRSVAPSAGHPIHASIRRLDGEAMGVLALPADGKDGVGDKDGDDAKAAHATFASYLARTKNTICGRHPIGVLLGALAALEAGAGSVGNGDAGGGDGQQRKKAELKWVRYEQSSACETIRDSSVSYASAWVRF